MKDTKSYIKMQQKRFMGYLIAILMVVATITSATAISEAPFWIKNNFDDFGLTVVDYRQPYSTSSVIYRSTDGICVYNPGEEEIPVNFRLSTPPESSLQTISISTGDADSKYASSGSCWIHYTSLATAENLYNGGELSPCSAYITVTGAKWRNDLEVPFSFTPGATCQQVDAAYCEIQTQTIVNPDCPTTYYISTNPGKVISKQGALKFDYDINNYVCADSNPDILYICYSDICGGQNLKIRDLVACQSSSTTKAKSLVNEFILKGEIVSSDNEVVSESDTSTSDESTSFFSRLWLKIKGWFESIRS